jgi:DNA-binding CsgD family transcriptional regulator
MVTRMPDTTSSGDALFRTAAEHLRQDVPYDNALWFAADPATLLPTAPARIENFETGHCETYWQREFLVEDVNLFRDLARAETPVASLLDATEQRPVRSARYRECLKPQGLEDELRAVVRDGGAAWGLISLAREQGAPAFTRKDMDRVQRVAADLSTSLRAAALQRAQVESTPNGPGLMMFDADGNLVSLNHNAECWIDELPDGPRASIGFGQSISAEVAALVARARAVAGGFEARPARIRTRTGTGRWLVMHASCLHAADGEAGQTVLVIEPAHAAEIAPIIVEAYQLTPREQEITRLIAQGASTSDIASTLFLSVHTVRDHIKAIFEKVSVSSRGELVAKLFAEHYAEPLHQHGVHASF